MDKILNYSEIYGKIATPSSKSALQRLIAASFLSKGKSHIHYQTLSEDAKAALAMIQDLGASVVINDETITIVGGFNNPATNLMIGESGLGLRMFSPILSTRNIEFTVNGKGSLLKRPVNFMVSNLSAFGVDISSDKGKLPLRLKGPITKNHIQLDGSFSSQLITGLLMALPINVQDSILEVNNLNSKPYIDLTISVLIQFGIDIRNENYQRFSIPGNQKYKAGSFNTEGDWSAAAFLFVAAAIAGELEIIGIDEESTQGDKAILDIIKKVGANVQKTDNGFFVQKKNLMAFNYDATDSPDLFPPLAALAVNCKGFSKIKGIARLLHKESNRAESLLTEFKKIGGDIRIVGDEMIIKGTNLFSNRLHSHNDHRIAMALSIASLSIEGEILIENTEAVGKSWPSFFEDLASIAH